MGKNMGNKVIKMLRQNIEQQLTQAEQTITTLAQQHIYEAKQLANQQLSYEINRLTALQSVNKNIRPTEISALEQQREQILCYIEQASWRLDSLRVVVSNKE